jgi:uncharacterized protein
MTENAKGQGVAALITRLENAQGTDKAPIVDLFVQIMMEGAKMPGFWSGEIIPPEDITRHDWRLVQRFSNEEQAKAWQSSELRSKLIQEFSAANGAGGLKVSDDLSNQQSFGDVATAIVTDVKPGMENEYFVWESKIQREQAKFPGFNGSYLQPPAPGKQGQWSTLLRFDKPESLQQWFASDERKVLLSEASKFVKSTRFQQMSNSYPGWFPVDQETGEGPPNWKTSMLVLLGLFPVVMLEIRFLSPLMTSLNPAVSSFLNLVLSVILTTWGTMPIFIKFFTWWLFPNKDNRQSIDVKGTLIMIALFVGEIAALSNLLPPHP